jgi:hypothetical protein
LRILLCSESDHWVEPGGAPGRNEAGYGSDQQQNCDHGQEYSRIKWARAIQHGADQLSRRNTAGYSECESEESRAKSIEQHQFQDIFSLRSKRDADADFGVRDSSAGPPAGFSRPFLGRCLEFPQV